MLIEKTDPTEVYCFKLVNGDELIARIAESDADSYLITDPATVVPSAQGIALIQSLFTMKEGQKIRLNRNHVMMFAEVDSRMRSHYIKTVTGLETNPDTKIII